MVERKKFKAYDTIPIYAPVLGLAGHVPPTMLKKQYAADCLNVRFKNGEVLQRTGYVDYGIGSITGVPLGFYRYQLWNGAEHTLLITTTNVYKLAAGAWSSIADTLSGNVDTRCSLCTIQNTMIMANSGDVAKKWDGATWANLGGATGYKPQIVLPYGERLVMFNVTTAGDELHTDANAASDPNENEANATTGWSELGCTLTPVTTDPQTGTYHLKCVSGDGGGDYISYDFAAVIGDKYKVSLWAKRGAQGTDQAITSWQGTTASPNERVTEGAWAEYTYTVTAAATTIQMRIYVAHSAGAANDEVYVDNVSIKLFAFVPIRVRWSAAGTFETWTGTGSSFFDVTNGMGAKIVGAELLGNYVGVYKDYSISLMDYVAGASIFAIDVHINNMGLAARSAIVNLHTLHVFLGWDNVYAWNGGWKLQEIGNPIKDALFAEINDSKIGRSFMLHCPREHEIHLFVPLGTDNYPTRFWTYRYELSEGEIKGVWSRGVLASISGAGSVTTGGVERALLGLSGGGIEHYDYAAVNDNGALIDGFFVTPDFPVSEEEYILEREMFEGFSAEARGHKITLGYSVNSGDDYTTMAVKTLQSTAWHKLEDWYFKAHGQQIRFKLRNNTVDETFRFRFYAIKVIPREAHK